MAEPEAVNGAGAAAAPKPCRWRRGIAVAVALGLGLAAWSPAVRAWFSAEELVLLYKVQGHPFGTWSGGEGPGFFRPVISLILWAGSSLWGIRPLPFHLLNLLMHLANSLFVYLIARNWWRSAQGPAAETPLTRWAPAVAALWFWIWPAHAEPVAWIPAITDVAAAFFGLASLACYTAPSARGGSAALVGAYVLYAVALGTKESVITLPAVAFLFELSRFRRGGTGALAVAFRMAAFAGVAAAYLVVRRLATGAFIGGYSNSVHLNFTLQQLHWALAPNLANAFFPVPGLTLLQKEICLAALGVIGAIMAWWCGRNQAHARITLLLMVLAALAAFAPAINLGPDLLMGGQRFAYFASAFSVMAVASLAVVVLRRGRWIAPAAWAVALVCGVWLYRYNMPRYVAGKMAKQIAKDMRDLPRARRLFVLATPATYLDAYIMPHGLEQVGKLMVPDFPVERVASLASIYNWTEATSVYVTPAGDGQWRVRLDFPQEKSEMTPRLAVASLYLEGWFTTAKDGETVVMTLRDFDPAQDAVAYIDGKNWKVVHRPGEE